MPLPQFSKAGMTTLVFTRGDSFPSSTQLIPRQLVERSEGGQTRVATLSDPDEVFVVMFERLSSTDATALRAWFSHTLINWQAESFTYTDVRGVATLVRFVGGTFEMPEVTSERYNVTLTLRKEPF